MYVSVVSVSTGWIPGGPRSASPRTLGGAFLSRLNAVLREEKGYTYGVRMNFGPLRTGGSFAVQGSFRTEVVVEALGHHERADQRRRAPFTSQEVNDAVAFFTGVSPCVTPPPMGSPSIPRFSPDFLTTTSTEAWRCCVLTPEAATEAYRSVVNPDELTLVVVGDAERLAEPLRATGFPDLEVRSPA